MSDFLVFDIIDIGLLERKIFSIETKNKACCVLSCRISGSTLLDTGSAVLNINPGDVLYIPKGSSYSQKTQGEDVVYVHLEVLGSKREEIQHLTFDNPEVISEYFKKMLNIWERKKKNYKYLCASIIYELIGTTSVMMPESNRDLLAPATEYINEHFCDYDFSLDDACKRSSISRSYFNRIFKERYGITPALYINQLKIEKSEFLLSCNTYAHNEIAAMCGFNDVKYFYTVFKKITGTTAKKYQKNK